jgi:Transposase DDE domain
LAEAFHRDADLDGVPGGARLFRARDRSRSRYDLAGPKTGQERESAFLLSSAHPHSLLFADGGFWGAEFHSSMELINIKLITPAKHKLGQRPPDEIAKARIRLIIESVFSNLKRQMRLEDHLAKTKPGLAQRIAGRLLALTIGIYLNILAGLPPRALAAYDGR